MGMWQDNSLLRITLLEDQVQAQSALIEELAKLVMDVTDLVVHQTAKEDSSYEYRGPERL